MRASAFVFITCVACGTTSVDIDGGADANTSGCSGQGLCFTSCEDDVPTAHATCVNGAWVCAFSCASCHCGNPCATPSSPSCQTCAGMGVAHVCNFDSGSENPYTCPPGSYDLDDLDAQADLCGEDAGDD